MSWCACRLFAPLDDATGQIQNLQPTLPFQFKRHGSQDLAADGLAKPGPPPRLGLASHGITQQDRRIIIKPKKLKGLCG